MKRDLEFLYEMGCLRFVQRTWRQFLGPNFQNVAEHTMRVMWLSLIIAEREKIKVNKEKLIKMVLVHDIPESRTGDVHYLSRQYTERFEEKAISEMLEGTSLLDFKEIWESYEKRECIESKIVKDADILDVDMEIHEQFVMGNQVRKDWKDFRRILSKSFFTKAAQDMWESIQTSNPHDWHLKANNRFNAGDWKKLADKEN
jgi:putative hydrolases of HD superfamily